MPSLKGLPALAAIALLSVSPAMAQSTIAQGSGTNPAGNTQTGNGPSTPNGTGQGGVTSGPAAGRPTTLGTGGVTTATPHQLHVTGRGAGTAVHTERRGQQGGTRSSVRPGQSDAGAGVHQSTNPQ